MPTWQVFPRRKRDARVRGAGMTAGAGSNAFGKDKKEQKVVEMA